MAGDAMHRSHWANAFAGVSEEGASIFCARTGCGRGRAREGERPYVADGVKRYIYISNLQRAEALIADGGAAAASSIVAAQQGASASGGREGKQTKPNSCNI